MLQAAEALPVNWGVFGKGNASRPEALREQVRAGACGLKDHEDWGTTPAVIDTSLRVADEEDVQLAIHTDTINEAGFVEDTIAAIAGRTIHTFHTEGAGGGHAPDIMRIAALPNVLPSSTNPTRPYTVNTLAEHLDMLMVCHHLNPGVPEDVAFAESRIRAETMAAEDVLHDRGVLSMYSSDSQAMGRIGESFIRLFQTAHKMRHFHGPLAGDVTTGNDNGRILRYLAKLTINPARTHGISHVVGSLEPGRLADIVLWPIPSFGVKPRLILKGGMVAWALMGDPNASIPTPEPVIYRPMFGALGRGAGGDVRHVHVAVGVRGWRPRAAGSAADGRAGAWLPDGGQVGHGAQRRDAGHRGRPRDLRGPARRRAGHGAARGDAAHDPALLPGLRSLRASGRDPDRSTASRFAGLLQLADSSFPSGAYTLSSGLETLVAERSCPRTWTTWSRSSGRSPACRGWHAPTCRRSWA